MNEDGRAGLPLSRFETTSLRLAGCDCLPPLRQVMIPIVKIARKLLALTFFNVKVSMVSSAALGGIGLISELPGSPVQFEHGDLTGTFDRRRENQYFDRPTSKMQPDVRVQHEPPHRPAEPDEAVT